MAKIPPVPPPPKPDVQTPPVSTGAAGIFAVPVSSSNASPATAKAIQHTKLSSPSWIGKGAAPAPQVPPSLKLWDSKLANSDSMIDWNVDKLLNYAVNANDPRQLEAIQVLRNKMCNCSGDDLARIKKNIEFYSLNLDIPDTANRGIRDPLAWVNGAQLWPVIASSSNEVRAELAALVVDVMLLKSPDMFVRQSLSRLLQFCVANIAYPHWDGDHPPAGREKALERILGQIAKLPDGIAHVPWDSITRPGIGQNVELAFQTFTEIWKVYQGSHFPQLSMFEQDAFNGILSCTNADFVAKVRDRIGENFFTKAENSEHNEWIFC
ncbi:MAG: hypothetical protein LBT98_03990 [Puniceicoccales bacterium]|nr:hypothetical protein [Puniceicoccales bacterium]